MKKIIGLTITCLLTFTLCTSNGKERSETKEVKAEKAKVLFEENFDDDKNIKNTEIWKLCTYANNAWSQHFKYVNGYENVTVENGYLKLSATKDGDLYKNGGIRTVKGFPNNTRVEVKARLNKVRGGFPAIWQMPIGGEEWPRSGEVDIMEWVQGTPNQIYQTVHTFFINGPGGSAGATNENPNKEFDITVDHIYAADRTDEAIIFYVDGVETWRYNNQYLEDEDTKLQFPFNKFDYDIILNFSLGGMLNGNKTWAGTIHDEDLPGEMWIDWVKVTEL